MARETFRTELPECIRTDIDKLVGSLFEGKTSPKINNAYMEMQQSVVDSVYCLYYTHKNVIESHKDIKKEEAKWHYENYINFNKGKCIKQHITGLFSLLSMLSNIINPDKYPTTNQHVTTSTRLKFEFKKATIEGLIEDEKLAPSFVLIGFPLAEALCTKYLDSFTRKTYTRHKVKEVEEEIKDVLVSSLE